MANGKNMGLLLLLGAAGAGYFLIQRKKKSVKKAVAASFGLKSVKLKGTNIIARVSLINPTNVNTVLKAFTGNIYTGKTAIATVKNFKPVKVPANKEIEMEVTLVPKAAGLFTGIKKLIKNGGNGKKMNLSLVGVANLGGNNMKVNIKF